MRNLLNSILGRDNQTPKKTNTTPDESKWNTIPFECEYSGKVYRILNIDMQGGYFTLQDLNAKKGDIQVIDNIDMDKCNPIK
jgi:hypothetical protein